MFSFFLNQSFDLNFGILNITPEILLFFGALAPIKSKLKNEKCLNLFRLLPAQLAIFWLPQLIYLRRSNLPLLPTSTSL